MVLLLPIHTLVAFAFAFGGSLLVIWKQILVLVLILLCIVNSKITYSNVFLLVFILCSFAVGVMWSLFKGVRIENIGFSLFFYFSFLFLLISNIKRNVYWDILKKSPLISMVLSLGIISDYLLPSFFNIFREYTFEFQSEISGDNFVYRPSFFFGSPSLVYVVLSLGVVVEIIRKRNFLSGSSIALIIIVGIALFLTGTRAALYSYVLLVFILIWYISKGVSRFLLVLFVTTVWFWIQNYGNTGVASNLTTRMTSDVFSFDSVGNDTRLRVWMEAYNKFVSNPSLLVLGEGVGTGFIRVGDDVKSEHFESSFLQALNEGGIPYMILRLIPFIIAVTFFVKRRKYLKKPEMFFIVWLLTVFLTFLVAPVAGAYHNQLYTMIVAAYLFAGWKSSS